MATQSGEQAFLRERARYLLAHLWCVEAAANGGCIRTIPLQHEDNFPAFQVAIAADWIAGESGRFPLGTIKAAGWKAATAFLKR